MLNRKKIAYTALLAFSILTTLTLLPAGREFVGYYECLSEIGREDYTSAMKTFNDMKNLRSGSYKVQDLAARINDMAQYHYKSANFYASIGSWVLAREEIKKAYTLDPENPAIATLRTKLNLADISSKDLVLQKGIEFSKQQFSEIQTNPYWDFVLALSDGVLFQYNFQGEKIRVLGTAVDKFCASADGSKYACVTTKIQGDVKTPEIWIGHTKQENERLKLISFRDHILRGFSGFSIDTDNIELLGFSPDNRYLFFYMLSLDSYTLWKYDYSSEKSETFEKVREIAFKPNSADEFCYTKPADKKEGDLIFKYSDKYGRTKLFFDALQNKIERPGWSPDGKYISFYLKNTTTGKRELYIITPNGKTQYNLGACEDTSEYMWSPQGDRLYYLRAGNVYTWLNTNKNYTLFDLDASITKFKLSPGGKKIIMLTEEGVWLGDSTGYNNGHLAVECSCTDLSWVEHGQSIAVWQDDVLITCNFQVQK